MKKTPRNLRLRGRNGYSSLENYQTFGSYTGNTWVEFYSHKIGKNPPAQIDGPIDNLIKLFEDILFDLKLSKEVQAK